MAFNLIHAVRRPNSAISEFMVSLSFTCILVDGRVTVETNTLLTSQRVCYTNVSEFYYTYTGKVVLNAKYF